MAGLFSPGLLRPIASPGASNLDALATDMSELPMRGTSPAPRFGAFAAALPRPPNPTWPRDPPPIEAAKLDEFLNARGSPMAGMGQLLLEVGWRYNIDPRLLVAISGADTGFGRVLCTDFNAWNWFWFEWCNSPFESWRQALEEVARGLRIHYLDQGLTDVQSIADRYGPLDDPRDTLGLNRHWPGNVIRYLEGLGGSRCNLGWVASEHACGPLRSPPPRVMTTDIPPETERREGEPAAEAEEAEEAEVEAWVDPSRRVAESSRLEESFSLPVQRPTVVALRALDPRDDVGPVWTAPPDAPIAPVVEPNTVKFAAAASVASPPVWTYTVVLLVGLLVASGRAFCTLRPDLPDPRDLMLRLRAQRDETGA